MVYFFNGRFERIALAPGEHNLGMHPAVQFLEEKQGREGMIPQFSVRAGPVSDYPDPVSLGTR